MKICNKKYVSLCTFLFLIITFSISAQVNKKCYTTLQVVINAQKVVDLPVYKIENINEKYISIKDLAKIFSATLTYYPVGKYVSFNCRGEKIYFFYNKNFFMWSKQKFYLNDKVININDRTFVPISILNNPSFTNILNSDVEFRQKENLIIVNWFDTLKISYYVTKNDAKVEFKFPQDTQYDYNTETDRVILTFFSVRAAHKEYIIDNSIISKIKLTPDNENVRVEIFLVSKNVEIKKEEYKDKLIILLEKRGELVRKENKNVNSDKIQPQPLQNEDKSKKVVVIDPGHGGEDPGAIGKYSSKEKDINLSISKLVKEKLTNAGYKVLLTREDDIFIPLVKRTQFANDNKADIFISIHCNASEKPTGTDHGVEVYFLSEKATDPESIATEKLENEVVIKYEKPTEELNKLQKILWSMIVTEYMNESSKLCSCIGTEVATHTGQNYRGVKQAGFYVLRGAQMPAVLVEVGFISHPNEELKLTRKDFQELIADGIVAGIRRYYENGKE